jgi:hypothetical protein
LVTGLPQFQSERVLHTEGLTHVAAGAGNSITNNGLLATLVFNATPDNPAYTFLPFSVNGEIAINSEGDTVAVVGSPLSLQLVNGSIGRVPLRMLDARRKSGGQFSLTVDQGFSGFIEPLDPGRHGEVEVWVSESLGRATNWIRLPNPLLIPGADGLLQVEDAPGPNLPRRFYQLRDP